MKRIFFLILAVSLCFNISAQDSDGQTAAQKEEAQKIQLLSQTFSRYLVNNMQTFVKSIRYAETTGKLQRGLQMQMSVILNKNGRIEDVLVYRHGINEIFNCDFRDVLLTMPKTVYEDITITGKLTYVPVLMDVKLTACDRKLADRMEDDAKAKRWKKFKLEDEELIKRYPKLAEYKSVKDVCNSSVWYIYYRLMNLRITVADATDFISHDLKNMPQPQESTTTKKKKVHKVVESEE